jgi:hypothetical protein
MRVHIAILASLYIGVAPATHGETSIEYLERMMSEVPSVSYQWLGLSVDHAYLALGEPERIDRWSNGYRAFVYKSHAPSHPCPMTLVTDLYGEIVDVRGAESDECAALWAQLERKVPTVQQARERAQNERYGNQIINNYIRSQPLLPPK